MQDFHACKYMYSILDICISYFCPRKLVSFPVCTLLLEMDLLG